MTNRLLIHVGYHKTGSTWLQQRVFASPDYGFRYWDGDRGQPRMLANILPLEFDAARAAQQFSDTVIRDVPDECCLVIARERLSGSPHSGGYDSKEYAERLQAVFPEARVLIVIREQQSAILSWYKHYLKVGGRVPLKKYLTQKPNGWAPMFSMSHYHYDRLIDLYQRLFGRDRVLVLCYEQLCTEPLDFLNQILRFSDLPEATAAPPDERLNASASYLCASLRRRLNFLRASNLHTYYSPMATKRGARIVDGMINGVDRVFSRLLSDRIEREWKKIIKGRAKREAFSESNQRTMDLTGLPLNEYGYVLGDPPTRGNRVSRGSFDRASVGV